jgi:hypothetical protein
MKDQVAVIRPLSAHRDSTECGEYSMWRRGRASVANKWLNYLQKGLVACLLYMQRSSNLSLLLVDILKSKVYFYNITKFDSQITKKLKKCVY